VGQLVHLVRHRHGGQLGAEHGPSSPRTNRRRSRDRRSGARSINTRARRSALPPNVTSSRTRAGAPRPTAHARRSRSCDASAQCLNGRRCSFDKSGRWAPPDGSEHGRSLPFCCRTRDNRATDRDDCGWPVPPRAPGIAACGVPERAVPRGGAVPCRGAVHEAGRKGMGEWRR